jgi:hypothetical protein
MIYPLISLNVQNSLSSPFELTPLALRLPLITISPQVSPLPQSVISMLTQNSSLVYLFQNRPARSCRNGGGPLQWP